jgi:hypothetical protein
MLDLYSSVKQMRAEANKMFYLLEFHETKSAVTVQKLN